MFALERQNQIKEILKKYKQINVASLATMLDVTKTTVRKDLDILEQEGFLLKMHGGAVLNETNSSSAEETELPRDDNRVEKQHMASIAVRLIRSGDILFLGGGSTCAFLADAIAKNKELNNLTIVTNNLYAVNCLAHVQNITLICVGGILSPGPSRDFYGPLTIKSVSERYFTKSFFSVNALNTKIGFMVARQEYFDLITAVNRQAESCFILADHTKFDQSSMLKLASLQEIPKIITDRNVPNAYKTYCFDHDIQLYTTIEAPSMK